MGAYSSCVEVVRQRVKLERRPHHRQFVVVNVDDDTITTLYHTALRYGE